MEKIRQSADYYDRMHEAGNYGGAYHLPYRHITYFPLFREVLAAVRRANAQSVLEVGCGSGAFSHLLLDSTTIAYTGFDFSAVAVEMARQRTGKAECYFVGDATSGDSYQQHYDTIVCTEVLEHIEDDLGAIDRWRPGTHCICSVPNYDSRSHVRFFRDETQVRARYGERIAMDRIIRIRKPVLEDISWRSYLNAVRWYRYRPRQLMAVLGIGSFDSLGGWFLFTGKKR